MPSVISLGELEKWLIDHSAIPEDENEPYVIFYYVYECETPIFRFGVSTKSLQKLSTVATNIHADATYKIIWQGFPVLVVGTTDKTKKFFPFCLAISSSERKEDFKMLFEELKKSVYTLYSYVMKPKDLICDAAKSIQNAFMEVFGVETTVKMCWAHAKKNIQKQVVKLIDKRLQKDLLQDIDILHSVTSPDVFDTALAAFLNKYESQRAFITYFKEEWIMKNPNWYLGASEGYPSTNNALEAFNRSIKDSHTLRERIPLSRFRAVTFDMVKQWSENYKVESFSRTPFIELPDWTLAYQWAKLNKKVKTIDTTAQQKTYLVESSANNVLNGGNWKTFDEFKKFAFTHWTVVLPSKNSDWVNGECNCPEFFKNYKCKHVTGLAIRLKYVIPPVEAKNIGIGQKRKRGRPTKAKRALLVQ